MRQIHAAAYAAPDALRTGFDWYRAFDDDVNDTKEFGQRNGTIRTPVLYLRGDKGWARIETYVQGFQAAGIQTIQSALIKDSGHFTAEEQPERLWQRISDFVRK
jgi:pimeloyl-ACP methyl ester carboxylesterase